VSELEEGKDAASVPSGYPGFFLSEPAASTIRQVPQIPTERRKTGFSDALLEVSANLQIPARATGHQRDHWASFSSFYPEAQE